MFGITQQQIGTISLAGRSRRAGASLLFLGVYLVLALSSTGCADPTSPASRKAKADYLAQKALAGEARIETVSNPGSGQVALGDHDGLYVFETSILPGQLVNVTVVAGVVAAAKARPVSIVYYPQYSPGYTFEDIGSGSTNITNLDSELPNGLLIVLEGDGTADVTVSVDE